MASQVRVVLIGCATLLFTLTAGTGCKSSSSPGWPENPGGAQEPPGLGALEAQLAEEFERLDIDPTKVTAAAPQGDRNAVFDMTAWRLYPPGSDPETVAPYAIDLAWTERLLGDYDQNGEVNAADLSPIAARFKVRVNYRAPKSNWPQGDPDAAGAENWRLARIDGDGNGEINGSDIATIAANWQAALSGYRIYGRMPGEAGFSILPDPLSDGAPVSQWHANSDNSLPVRYSYQVPLEPGETGVAVFYVAPFDVPSGTEGPASAPIAVNIQTGEVDYGPVARLVVSPDYVGAPAQVTLDASSSSDPDGSITQYLWDVDGDGIPDWSSGDPLPEGSSSGAAIEFVSENNGAVLRVIFDKGSNEYYKPSVTVVDDDGLESAPSSAQLAVSGWELELIKDRFNPEVSKLHVGLIKQMTNEPATGRLAVIGKVRADHHGTASGLFYCTRNADGTWNHEHALDINGPEWYKEPPEYNAWDGSRANKGIVNLRALVWDHGRPVILFTQVHPGFDSVGGTHLWSVERYGPSDWRLTRRVTPGTQIKDGGTATAYHAMQDGQGYTAVIGVMDHQGAPPSKRYLARSNDGGAWDLQYTGFASNNDNRLHPRMLVQHEGQELVLFSSSSTLPGVWAGHWDGEKVKERRLDAGDLDKPLFSLTPISFISGKVSYGLYELSTNPYECVLFEFGPEWTTTITPQLPGFEYVQPWRLIETPKGVGVFARAYETKTAYSPEMAVFYQLQHGKLHVTRTVPRGPVGTVQMDSFSDACWTVDNRLVALFESDGGDQVVLAWYVDPTL